MKKIIFLMSLLMISLVIHGTTAVKQGNPDNKSGIISFDDGWRFLKDSPDRCRESCF